MAAMRRCPCWRQALLRPLRSASTLPILRSDDAVANPEELGRAAIQGNLASPPAMEPARGLIRFGRKAYQSGKFHNTRRTKVRRPNEISRSTHVALAMTGEGAWGWL